MAHHLSRLAVQAVALGGFLQRVFVGPLRAVFASGQVQITACRPNLCRFHSATTNVVARRNRQVCQWNDPNGLQCGFFTVGL